MNTRILMLARGLATGTLTYTTNLIDSLQKAGVEVVVAYAGANPPQLPCAAVRLDVGITRALGGHYLTQGARSLSDALGLRKLVRRYRPHVIYAQGMDELALTAVIASRLYGIPSVTFVHDLTIEELRLAKRTRILGLLLALSLLRQKLVAKRLSTILVSSKFMENALVQAFGVSPTVTPLGVSSDFYLLPVERERAPFRLVFVGNLTAKKMPNVAIMALSYLPEIDVRLTIVGDGPMKEELEQLCQRLNLGEKVKFAGRLNQSELLREVGSAHACVVPSIWEGFGLAALEAMAAGVPVIASCSGALGEIVKHGRDGLLFAPTNAEELAANVKKLAQDESLRKRLADNCRLDARGYAWDGTGLATLQAIRQVVGKG